MGKRKARIPQPVALRPRLTAAEWARTEAETAMPRRVPMDMAGAFHEVES
jgi:hypothetical protein